MLTYSILMTLLAMLLMLSGKKGIATMMVVSMHAAIMPVIIFTIPPTVEMRKPSKFCSVKWIIMYIFFLLVIGFMLLGTGLLHFIPPPDFHNLTCYAQSDSAIYVEVNLSSIWHYKLNISVKKDCGIGTCIQNCTMESPLNCTALKYDNNTFPSIGAFSPWTFSTSSCFYFDLPQANRDINKYNVTTHYNKRVDILFWPGLPIVLVIIVLFAVSVCHFVWFKIKNRQKYVMFEVNG